MSAVVLPAPFGPTRTSGVWAEALDGDIVVIEAGAIAQRGRLTDLVAQPRTEFVRQFVAGRAL